MVAMKRTGQCAAKPKAARFESGADGPRLAFFIMAESGRGMAVTLHPNKKSSARRPRLVEASCSMLVEMNPEKSRALNWHLTHIREAIASDWDALATGKLDFAQRKSVREHWRLCVT